MTIKKLIIALATLSCGTVLAEGGFYTGAGLGYANLSNTTQGNLVLGNSNSGQTATGNGLGGNLYFGYDFNHYIGLQEEYDMAFNSNIANSYSANAQIFGTTLLFHLPFALFSNNLAGLDIFAKGGIGYEIAGFSGNSSCNNCVNPSNQNGAFVPMYGAGIEYGFTNVGYRLEWDGVGSLTNTNGGVNQVAQSANLYLLSIMYHF